MHNRLATAALIALLGMIADVRRPAAQPAQAEGTPREALALLGCTRPTFMKRNWRPRSLQIGGRSLKITDISGSATW